MTQNSTTEIVASQRGLGDDVLSEISDFASALSALDEAGIGFESISDYGTGFTVVDKEKLVGVPFIVLEWRFNDGKFGDVFASLAVVTKNGDKYVINDGSTGIREQLQRVSAKRVKAGSKSPQAGLMVPNGLSVSNYVKEIDGKETPARTFYLSESPATA